MLKLFLGGLILAGLIFVRQQIRRAIERRQTESGGPRYEFDRMIRHHAAFDVDARRQR